MNPRMLTKKILLMLLLGITLVVMEKQIFTMEPEIKQIRLQNTEKYTYIPKSILIFLDETEKNEGVIRASSNKLLVAMAEKAGPIIVSTSLLQNIFSEYGKKIPMNPSYSDFFKSTIGKSEKEKNEALIQIFDEQKFYQKKYKNHPASIVSKYIALKALRFNPHEWIIKKIDAQLCLLIPIMYLKSCNMNLNTVREDTARTTSDAELEMGLKVNHMKTVTIENIIQEQTTTQKDATYFIKALYNETTQTSDIFCLNSEYVNKNIPLPIWAVYLSGHGDETKISAIKTEYFKKILNTLESKINCRIFIYTSCCAAGLNIEKVYKKITSTIQNRYSFPIIVNALSDATTRGGSIKLTLDDFNNLTLKSQTELSFTNFLQKTTKQEITNYQDIIKQINPLSEPNNMPQIKMPGLEWFSPIDQTNFVSIGETLTKTRNPNQPLNIETFFKTDPKVILLYAANIPFELKLDSKNLEAIVSMVPGDAVHTIKKISSTKQPAIALIDMFMKNTTNVREKIFFIKEIQGSDKSIHNVIVRYNKIPGLTRLDDKYNCFAYFIDGNSVWFKQSLESPLKDANKPEDDGSKPHLKQYQSYLERVTGEPQKADHAYYNKLIFSEDELFLQEGFTDIIPTEQIRLEGLLPLGERCIINTMEEPSKPLVDLLQAVRNTQPKDAITWIKKLTGIYNTHKFSLHNDFPDIPLTNDSVITLNNVIIEKNKKETLFTFNGNFYQNKTRLDNDYLPKYSTLLTNTIPPFSQREGSLLPSSITAKGIKKIKKITPSSKATTVQKQKYQKTPQGKWIKKEKLLTNYAAPEAEHR